MPKITRFGVTLICALLSLRSVSCLAQTAGDAAILAEIHRQRMQEEIDWNASKKLSLWEVAGSRARITGTIPILHLKIGDIGTLEDCRAKLIDVIDERNCTLSIEGVVVWLSDFSTDGLHTDQKIRLIGPVEAVGTRTYSTVAGSKRTVIELKFVDKKRWVETTFPKFKTKDGSEFQAQLKSFDKGVFVFEGTDGENVSKPIGEFSKSELEALAKVAMEVEGFNSTRTWVDRRGNKIEGVLKEIKGVNCVFQVRSDDVIVKREQLDKEGQEMARKFLELSKLIGKK